MFNPVKFVALLFIVHFIDTVATDFTVVIGPGRRECFYKDLQKGITLESNVGVNML